MKKIYNTILIMGLLLMTGYFLVPVYANGGTEEVIIQDVRQNNNILEHSGNTYQIADYRYNPQILFYINNAKKNTYYNVYFYSNEEDYSYSTIYNKTNGIEYYEKSLNLYATNSNYTIKLCTTDGPESKTCVSEIATKTITLSYADYDRLNFDDVSLVVTKVMQGDEEITPTFENDTFNYNITSLDDVKVSLKGTNFDNTLTYELDVNDDKMYYSGSLLNDGITISSYPIYNEYLYISAYLKINNQLLNIKQENESTLYNVNFNYDVQKNNNLKYTITPSGGNVDPAVYQNNKVINFRLKASNFEDRDYLAKVYVSYLYSDNRATVVYSEEKEINGLDINSGYNYTINDVTLPVPSELSDIGAYLISVVIDGNVRGNSFFYKGNGTLMTSKLYYGDHTSLLRPDSGMGYPVMSRGGYTLNMLLPDSDKVYIHYSSAASAIEEDWIDFIANKEYNYVLSRGYHEKSIYNGSLIYEEVLETGTVMGEDINNANFIVELDVPTNILAPSGYNEVYRMAIYDGDIAVTYAEIDLYRNYNPPIASYELKSNNQVLNARGYNDYLIPNEFDLNIKLNGYGFDENKDYTIDIFESRTNMRSCYEDCGEQFETTIPHEQITVNGKDLNDGYLVTLSANDDDLIKYGNLSLSIGDGADTIYNDYFTLEFYDKDKEEIEIVSVMQDNTELTMQNGKYIITDPSKRITLNYKFKNIKDGKLYDYSFTTFGDSNNMNHYDATLDNTMIHSARLVLNPNASETTYTIHLCKNNQEHNCTKEWDSKQLDFVLNDYQEYDYENSKILVTKVMQGGVEVTPTKQDGYYHYNLNDVENAVISIKGENLKSDANYYVGYTGSPYMEWRYISGAALMEGLDITVTIKTNAYVYFEVSLPVFSTLMNLEYRQNEDLSGVMFDIAHNEEVPDYQFDVTYKNELACIQTYKGSVNVDPATYVNKNGIDILFSGTNYEDKDYSINVKVLNRSNEVVYNENATVNGLALNAGYRYYLNNLEFLPRETIQDFGSGYFIVVTVNNATSQLQVLYNSSGSVNSKIYYSNGIEVIRDAINPYKIMNYQIKYLDQSIIGENNEITVNYTGSDYDLFNDNFLYNYELVKGKMVYDYLSDLTNKTVLDSGTVRGNVLNDTGLSKVVTISDNMALDDAYMMVIKNGTEIVSYDIIQFRFTDEAMFIVSKLYDGDEEITNPQKGYDINYYHDTRLHLMTIGLDNNKEYTLRFVRNSNLDEQNVITDVTVSGSKLNSGYDYLLPAVTNEEMVYADMSVTLLDNGSTIDTLYYTLLYMEKYHPIVRFNSIKQANQQLEKVNDKYVALSFDSIYVDFEVDNYDPTRNYYIKVIGGLNNGSVNAYNINYHEYPISFSRSQIEGEYILDPICPVVDGYTLVSRNGTLCTYEKPSTSTSNPTCPVVEGYDFILRDGDTCNYQMEYQVQTGVEYDPLACDDSGCNGAYIPVYETQYAYTTATAICESGNLNNGICVLQTTSSIVRDVICQDGTLQGDKCVVDTSDGYNGTYTYVVCADDKCDHPYASSSFTINYQMPELVNRSTLQINSMTQGGREITLDENNYYHVNSLETIELTLKAQNLVSDTTYAVGDWYNPTRLYTGSELNNGVSIKIYGDSQFDSDKLTVYIPGSSVEVLYPTNEHGDRVYLSFYSDDSLIDFTYELSYLNYQDKEIKTRDSIFDEYYFNLNYFNSSNPLKIRINSNVSDTEADYDVRVGITKDGVSYYDNTVTIKGNRLTSGYEYFISNLDLPLITEVGENTDFILSVEVNSISHQAKFVYNSLGDSPAILDRVYYKNDKEHLQAGKGSGGSNWGGPIYSVSDKLFTDHNHVYIKYYPATKYQDDVTYTYSLEYFGERLWNIENRNSTILKSGTIKGSEFNTYGLVLEISNPNNYMHPSYGLVVKNGDEVLYMGTPGLELMDIVTLTSIRVMANNTDATYDGNKYIIPRDRTVYGIISGIGFDDDKEYTINLGQSYYVSSSNESDLHTNKLITLSGYDLNRDGIKFVIDEDVSDDYSYATYGSDYNMSEDIYFRDAIYIQYREPDPEIGDFEAVLTYHNEEKEVYYVEPSKFNASGLDILINGQSFQDKKYPVSVRIMNGEDTIYEKTIEVEGLELNDGYHCYLDELELELVTTIPRFEYSGYNIDVIVNGINKNYFFTYNSRGEVIPRIYYNNTGKEAKAFAGSGEAFADYRHLKLNRNMLNQNNQLTFKYQGYMFDNSKNYTYEFIKGTHYGNMFVPLTNQSVLDQGTVSGATLNNEGIIKKISINPNAYNEDERYLLIIRRGEEIVHYSIVGFVIIDTPMITNYDILVDQNIITKNRDTYLLNFHTAATMMINGVDFEANKDYRVIIEEEYEDYCDEFDNNCTQKTFEYVFKGSRLNSGFEYSITINDNEEVESKTVGVVVIDVSTEEMIDSSCAYIRYATPIYFFDEGTEYTVDEDTSVIKGIKKETNFEDFIDSLVPYEGVSVKLFDATGEVEITTNIVGTGMILKVLDEETYESFAVPIVIKGDISGDGHISISDIIKVKKHLINIDTLTGIYEIAGDVTNTGNISTTDLVKLARDLANIEELG